MNSSTAASSSLAAVGVAPRARSPSETTAPLSGRISGATIAVGVGQVARVVQAQACSARPKVKSGLELGVDLGASHSAEPGTEGPSIALMTLVYGDRDACNIARPAARRAAAFGQAMP